MVPVRTIRSFLATLIFPMLAFLSANALASAPEIVKATMERGNAGWTFHVTLKHPDTGWDHYADGWRVVTKDGKVLGMRVLYHPHEEEQPFTRSLTKVMIPANVSEVFIEARCKKTGWGKQRYRISLK